MTRQRQAWMWMQACEQISQAERLRQQFFNPGNATAWEPPIDLIQSGSHLHLSIALPGVASEHVSVQLDNDGLLIEAVRPRDLKLSNAAIHRLEIPYGRFARRVQLPAGTYELKEKFFRNGCLSLHLIKHD
ncbi:MAG: Hsp20/alpha crystallin family protein [Steroidobacteraceae bacterium]